METEVKKLRSNPIKKIYLIILFFAWDKKFVDLLGSGFTDKKRPAPFAQRHIDRYRKRSLIGMGKVPPEELSEYFKKGEAILSNHIDVGDGNNLSLNNIDSSFDNSVQLSARAIVDLEELKKIELLSKNECHPCPFGQKI